jgi:hypothetical protein
MAAQTAMSAEKEIKPNLRPVDYTAEIGDVIWNRLLDGEGIRSICADPDMPDKATFYRWLRQRKEFRKVYASACRWRANDMGEEMYEILFEEPREQVELVHGGRIVRTSARAHSSSVLRIRVEVRKWVMTQLCRYTQLLVQADESK